MGDEVDKEGKTEQATERRFRESVEKGQVPVSREAVLAASLLSAWVVLMCFAGNAALESSAYLARLFERAAEIRLESNEDVQALLKSLVLDMARQILPGIAVLAAIGFTATSAQSRKLIAWSRLTPDFSRLSLKAGLGRIFGQRNIQEFAKSVIKLALVSALALAVIREKSKVIWSLMLLQPTAIASGYVDVTKDLFLLAALAMLVLGALDIALARFQWLKGLRMSRQEVQDETKQSEGDQALRARRRAIAAKRVRKRLKASVSRATLVVTNPTHYAVALRYVHNENAAPIVVAKGADELAGRIRKFAKDGNIPIVENRALARTLYARVDVERAIPPELYRAVADILIYLQRRGALNAKWQ